MKILAFAASNSKQSINRTLAAYVASLLTDATVEILDINDYEMPIFSDEREQQLGQPQLARKFFAKVGGADALIVSYAEHNGSYTAAYKNLFDWTSRISSKVYQNKPMLMLSTSPGPGGAASVLTAATISAPHFAGDVKGSVSVPSFFDNFDLQKTRFTNAQVEQEVLEAVQVLQNSLSSEQSCGPVTPHYHRR